MKKIGMIVLLILVLGGCAGSGGVYKSDQGVRLYVQTDPDTADAVPPEPEEGWNALVEEVAVSDEARRAGAQGEVVARVTVDDDGTILAVEIEESLGYGLEKAVYDAVANIPFKPGTVGATPSQQSLALVFAFERQLAFTVQRK